MQRMQSQPRNVKASPHRRFVFLDQEEGGRLLEEQAAYLLAWTEAVAASNYRPGVYASGQRVQDDPGVWIDTIEDIRARVKKSGLHEVAIFDALDQCPPVARVHAACEAAERRTGPEPDGVAVLAVAAAAGDHAELRLRPMRRTATVMHRASRRCFSTWMLPIQPIRHTDAERFCCA